MKYRRNLILELLVLSICWIVLFSCDSKQNDIHIFYLHGKIVQEQGLEATSEKFGKYEYRAIIDSLKGRSKHIYSEIRKPDTEFNEFCVHTSNQIDSLIKIGVEPKDILIIGASMGGVMAMQISTINENPVNYVFLGANNNSIEEELDFDLHGRILGIYEKSDSICGNDYKYWINKCEKVDELKEIQINTQLGHGFLYRPLKEWIDPIKEML